LVAALKTVVEPYERQLREEDEVRATIAERRAKVGERRATAERLTELRARFIEIADLAPIPRGYAFEVLLRDLFDAFDLGPKGLVQSCWRADRRRLHARQPALP
jgi:hypothetical protein